MSVGSHEARRPGGAPAVGFLGALDPAQVKALRERGVQRRFRKGQALSMRGPARTA